MLFTDIMRLITLIKASKIMFLVNPVYLQFVLCHSNLIQTFTKKNQHESQINQKAITTSKWQIPPVTSKYTRLQRMFLTVQYISAIQACVLNNLGLLENMWEDKWILHFHVPTPNDTIQIINFSAPSIQERPWILETCLEDKQQGP